MDLCTFCVCLYECLCISHSHWFKTGAIDFILSIQLPSEHFCRVQETARSEVTVESVNVAIHFSTETEILNVHLTLFSIEVLDFKGY